LHARPLTRVGLRYFVAEAADGPVIVGQRLKRMETIRDKLERHPKMALSRIHDIGGCRAVLPNQTAVDHVIERLRAQRGWDLLDRTWRRLARDGPPKPLALLRRARHGRSLRVRARARRDAGPQRRLTAMPTYSISNEPGNLVDAFATAARKAMARASAWRPAI
jgi:hypothetical protein